MSSPRVRHFKVVGEVGFGLNHAVRGTHSNHKVISQRTNDGHALVIVNLEDTMIHSQVGKVELVEHDGKSLVPQVSALMESINPPFDKCNFTILTVAWWKAHVDSCIDRAI